MESLRNLLPFKSYFHFRFLLPVSWPTFVFSMSADVGQCRQCHFLVGHGRNVGVAAKTALKYIFDQKLFLLPVLVATILNFGCRPMSVHVISAISESGVVENVGVALKPRRHLLPFKSYLGLYFPHVDFRVLSRHFGTSGQSKREAMTSSCTAVI